MLFIAPAFFCGNITTARALAGTSLDPSVNTVCIPIFLVQRTGLVVTIMGVLFILMKGDFLVLNTLKFNSRDLLVVMRKLAFAFYSVGLKDIDPGLTLLFRLCKKVFVGAIWHLPFVGYAKRLSIVLWSLDLFRWAFGWQKGDRKLSAWLSP